MKKLSLIGLLVLILIIVSGFNLLNNKNLNIKNPLIKNKTNTETTKTPNQNTSTTNNQALAFPLEILEPSNQSTLVNSILLVKGKTVIDAEIFINDTELKADKNGLFSGTINLDEGENTISIIANDQNGNSVEKEITVFYEPR